MWSCLSVDAWNMFTRKFDLRLTGLNNPFPRFSCTRLWVRVERTSWTKCASKIKCDYCSCILRCKCECVWLHLIWNVMRLYVMFNWVDCISSKYMSTRGTHNLKYASKIKCDNYSCILICKCECFIFGWLLLIWNVMWLYVIFGWVDCISFKVLCDYVLYLIDNMWLCVMFGWISYNSSKIWCDQLIKDLNAIAAKHSVHSIWNTNVHK